MSLYAEDLIQSAQIIIDEARAKKLHLVTAESCTGGIIAGCLTEIAGSSDVFDRGFVCYSYDSKMAQLDVARKTINDFGAVSAETALEMAEGALRASHADISIAITGIAGPGGGTAEKPVGLVYIGVANGKNANTYTLKHNFAGDRSAVRLATLHVALDILHKEIGSL
jgi:nicotinamide-nucleotide amidase